MPLRLHSIVKDHPLTFLAVRFVEGGVYQQPKSLSTPSVEEFLFSFPDSSRRLTPSEHWRRSGSNRQPLPCKGSALPVELRPRFHQAHQTVLSIRQSPRSTTHGKQMSLGVRGLEPRTSALSELRSNHLSYTPRKMFPYSGADILPGFCPVVQSAFRFSPFSGES